MSNQQRAAIYVRCATTQELGLNFPLSSQLHECKEYAIKEEYEVVEEFQEVGSGSSIDRPILNSLLEVAKEGRFEALIIPSFDRISRNTSLAAEVFAKLAGYGVKVLSATEDVEMGRMIDAILEEVGKMEKERISSRARAGRQAKKLA